VYHSTPQTTEWESTVWDGIEYLQVPGKEERSRIDKEPQQVNNNKRPVRQWVKDLRRHFSKTIQKWPEQRKRHLTSEVTERSSHTCDHGSSQTPGSNKS
jgi:hypothetical protein